MPLWRIVDSALVLVAGLLIWEALYRLLGSAALASPGQSLFYIGILVGDSDFWGHVNETGAAFAVAVSISIVAGVGLGLLLGTSRFAADVAEPIIASTYSIPKITLYPVILLIFGLGMSAKVALGVIHGVLPIMLYSLAAVRTINPTYLRTARVMRLSPAQTGLTVIAPALVPEIFAGIRVGFSLTFLGVIIGEMFASQRGLGFLVVNGINLHDLKRTMAVALLIVLFAVCSNAILMWISSKLDNGRPIPSS